MSIGIVHGIALLLVFFTTTSFVGTSGPKLVCYFGSNLSDSFSQGNFAPESIDPHFCTHINYGFANLDETTYELTYGNRALDVDEDYYGRVVALKERNPDLKVLLSVGGWDDSTKKYSDLVADPYRRSHFIQTAVAFLLSYGFDGLDIAWEYPNCWQGSCGINPDDVGNFVELLSELRTAFDPESLQLTASVSAVREEIDVAYDVPSISRLVDHINVMSYDLHGGWEKKTGHHAQFFQHPRDEKPSLNLNTSVNHWIYKGADKSKLIIGIPSYGRSYTLANPKKSGLYVAALGVGKPGPETNEEGLIAFHEICDDLDSWTYAEDKRAGTYAVKGNQWVGFDSPKSAVSKARYILHRGLGGASYKSFFTDDYKGSCFGYQYPILRSIHYGLKSSEEKDFEKTETDIRTFMEKVQLSILVEDNRSIVSDEERHTGASEEDVVIKLTEKELTKNGKFEIKEMEVNAGTLDATGDDDAGTLTEMEFALSFR